MIIRHLEKSQYDRLCRDLADRAFIQPLDPSYSVTLHLDGTEYLVKLQPEHDCQMAVLHALEVHREEDGPDFYLITDNRWLTRFLDILLALR